MNTVAPTYRCPFCHELCRPNGGSGDVKDRDPENYYRESEHSYACSSGHEFTRIEMVTGIRTPERKTA